MSSHADGPMDDDGVIPVVDLVEKPPVEEAPSNKIISGRYILQPEVMRTLENQEKGAGGEIQLTDAMARMIGTQPFHAVTFGGKRYDCGSKLGFIEATLALAMERDPLLNVFLDGDKLMRHDGVHIGLAVALDGGLLVSVLPNGVKTWAFVSGHRISRSPSHPQKSTSSA